MKYFVLGPIEVTSQGRGLRIGGPREQKLLTTLLLEARKVISVPRLVMAIWDQRPPATAKAQVHNSVATLRRNLVSEGGVRVPIARSGPGFVIGAEDDAVDAARFTAMIQAASRLATAGNPGDAYDLLREALAMWRGPALGGWDTGILGSHARRLDDMRLSAVEQRIGLDLELGRHDAVIGEVASLSNAHPLRERLVHLHMLALFRAGRRQDALDVYAAARRRLADESGLDPMGELDDLHRAILRGDHQMGTQPQACQHISYSVPPPAQLPADVHGFAGRGEEFDILDSLDRDRARGVRPHVMVAIVGRAGVGKSALALRWAHERRLSFPDGQIYLDLRGDRPQDPLMAFDAAGRLLRGLGVPDSELAGTLDERSAQWRSRLAGRRIMVVLDNAQGCEQVRPLLPGVGAHTVLVTSQHRLDGLAVHEGARIVPLAPLPESDARQLLRTAIAPVRAAAAALTELARLCDRLPLALRIAAARISAGPTQTVDELLVELTDERRRLAGLSLPAEQIGVITTLGAMFASLSAKAQNLLLCLGLHPQVSVSLAACATLSATGLLEAHELMAAMAAQHVITQVDRAHYRLPELTRLYARQRAVDLMLVQRWAAARAHRARDPHAIMAAEGTLARLHAAAGEPVPALACWRRVARAARVTDERRPLAEALAGIGSAHASLGDRVAARRELWQAMSLFADLDPAQADRIRGLLAEVCEA